MTLPDSIDPAFGELLRLFDGPLNAVSFPDVDRSVLLELTQAVRASAEEVARAEAALEATRISLEENQLALLSRGQRALAYARVYAEDNEPLQAELARITLPRTVLAKPSRSERGDLTPRSHVEPATKPRGRPRKAPEPSPLFATNGADTVEPSIA